MFRCAVVRVEREEQWGENTALRISSDDRTGCWMCVFPASLAAACLSVTVDPLTDGGGHGELS